MSANIISPDEADLLIHRFVTERIPVMAWFVSADGSMRVKVTGFVSSSTRAAGLHIVSEILPEGPMPAFMTFTGISGSVCQYSDDSQVPADFEFGSGLRLLMPNGDSLTIVEIRDKKRRT